MISVFRRPRLIAIFLAASIGWVAPAHALDLILPPDEHVIELLVNDVPVRLRVDPETSGYIILNGEAARRVGLRPSWTRGRTSVGPVRISGSTKVARVRTGGIEQRRRIVWSERRAIDDADGLIGPADLPFERVVMRLRDAAPGERVTELPMIFDRSTGLVHAIGVDDQSVQMQISTVRENTIATAAAGALLAAHFGGAWAGDSGEQLIKYEVVRPVRPMVLDRAVSVAQLPLENFLVRTVDNRSDQTLPPEEDADPDEIVVVGEAGRQQPRYQVSLGLDWLAGCSSLTWDNRSQHMLLSCI